MEFKQGDIDIRFINERLQWTETVCDCCGVVILESEERFELETHELLEIRCETCRPIASKKTGNILAIENGVYKVFQKGYPIASATTARSGQHQGKFHMVSLIAHHTSGRKWFDTPQQALKNAMNW